LTLDLPTIRMPYSAMETWMIVAIVAVAILLVAFGLSRRNKSGLPWADRRERVDYDRDRPGHEGSDGMGMQ
jgi:hypothetical protein